MALTRFLPESVIVQGDGEKMASQGEFLANIKTLSPVRYSRKFFGTHNKTTYSPRRGYQYHDTPYPL